MFSAILTYHQNKKMKMKMKLKLKIKKWNANQCPLSYHPKYEIKMATLYYVHHVKKLIKQKTARVVTRNRLKQNWGVYHNKGCMWKSWTNSIHDGTATANINESKA